jgi:hypothetical protein
VGFAGAAAITGRCTVPPNIFQKLGSGSRNGTFANPILTTMIKVEAHNDEPAADNEFGINNAFDCNEKTLYRSGPAAARKIRFFLPDFIKVKPTSLTMTRPVKGLRSWRAQGRSGPVGRDQRPHEHRRVQ